MASQPPSARNSRLWSTAMAPTFLHHVSFATQHLRDARDALEFFNVHQALNTCSGSTHSGMPPTRITAWHTSCNDPARQKRATSSSSATLQTWPYMGMRRPSPPHPRSLCTHDRHGSDAQSHATGSRKHPSSRLSCSSNYQAAANAEFSKTINRADCQFCVAKSQLKLPRMLSTARWRHVPRT